jgi:hypothetical protein
MAELKTKATGSSVEAFIDGIANDRRRDECRRLIALMTRVTRAQPVMWGPSIVGFGAYHYRYASGREGDWFLTGFSPRKAALTLYLMGGLERQEALLRRLGKYKAGKGCLYVKSLGDIDVNVLRSLLTATVRQLKAAEHQPDK